MKGYYYNMGVGDCKKQCGVDGNFYTGVEETPSRPSNEEDCSQSPDFANPVVSNVHKATELVAGLPARIGTLWSRKANPLSSGDGPRVEHIAQPTQTTCKPTSRKMFARYFATHPEIRKKFEISVPKNWHDKDLMYLENMAPNAEHRTSVAGFEGAIKKYLANGGPVIVKTERLEYRNGDYRHKSYHYLVIDGKPKFNGGTGRYSFELVDPGTFETKNARDEFVFSQSEGTWVKYPKVGSAKKDRQILKVLGYLPYKLEQRSDKQV